MLYKKRSFHYKLKFRDIKGIDIMPPKHSFGEISDQGDRSRGMTERQPPLNVLQSALRLREELDDTPPSSPSRRSTVGLPSEGEDGLSRMAGNIHTGSGTSREGTTESSSALGLELEPRRGRSIRRDPSSVKASIEARE